ncbi:MAG TPA: RDD family protein [Flavipsychrobacter sp.]|nr:RDD family protein [Flavipsychrobacter sp.]
MEQTTLSGSIFPKRIITHANVWERFAALLIDGLIVLMMSIIISSQIPFPYNWIFAAWLYEATQVSGNYQATIGQRTMGIKVSNIRGGQLDFITASLRHFCKYISLFTALSGYLIIILDKRKQCLHDKIAQAVVVTDESFHATTH